MALIKCKECGKDFSDTSNTCPGCGWTRRKQVGCLPLFFVGLGIWLFIGFILGFQSVNNRQVTAQQNQQNNRRTSSDKTYSTLKKLKDLEQNNRQNPSTDVCKEGIPILEEIINTNAYQTNVSQIMSTLQSMPNIKQCSKYKNIADILNMAEGYKNVKWGTSLEKVRSVFGKMWFASWQNEDEFDYRSDIFSSLPKESFYFGRQWDNLQEENSSRNERDRGLVSARLVKMYVNGDKRFLFYNNKFFAYAEDLPWADDKGLYLRNLQQKYGQNTTRSKGDWGLASVDMVYTWTFGDTYIVLHDFHHILYIDKKVLDELNSKYESIQRALKEQERSKNNQRQQQAQNAANNL